MSSKQSCWETYNKQMSEHNYGDALWHPGPPLPDFKRIQPGDVGYIRRGRFNLLFSAGHSGERQLGTNVPRTFKPLEVGPIDSFQRLPGYLSSPNIREIEARYPPSVSTVPMLEPGSSISFQLAEDQGAVLVTKFPTYQEDIQLIGNFEKYTKDHYDSWVAFARKTGHGDNVKPILVTGVDLTRDFAMMACPNNSEQKTFRFATSAPGVGSVWGTWHSKVPIYTNSGPRPSRTPPPTQTVDPLSPGISGTDTAPDEVIKAAAGPHDLAPGGYDDESCLIEEQSASDPDSDTVSSLFDNDEEGGSSVISSDSEDDTAIHNTTPEGRDDFDAIADYIFQNSGADSALIHHQDIALLREPGSGRDLYAQLVEKCPQITVDETGVGKIEDKENPPANLRSYHRFDGNGGTNHTGMDILESPADEGPPLVAYDPQLILTTERTILRQRRRFVLGDSCDRVGQLPESYLLSDKFDISGKVVASGGFADVRKGTFKGKNVAIKTLRVSLTDDKAKIRRHFCREVAMWKNLSHPNVLTLIGVPDTLDEGRFSMVSEWMANGDIVEYVRNNAGNHLQLLAGAIEGLSYLHKANIVHGGLKGADILITNTNPISACLADFGFTTTIHDPGLETESSESTVARGTSPFIAPELLVPSRFGLEKCVPTKGADIYAMAMVIYQALTGSLPYGKLGGPEVIFKVLGGQKPLKPANAIELGLSDRVWRLLEDCWNTDSASRPSVKEVSACFNLAASTCGILSPTGGTSQQYEDPDSDLFKFYHLFPDDDELDTSLMERPDSEGSTLTDTSLPDSLFSNLSEAASNISEPPPIFIDGCVTELKDRNTGAAPDVTSRPMVDDTHPSPRPPTPYSASKVQLRPSHDNPSPYRDGIFAHSNGNSRTTINGVASTQGEGTWSGTVTPHEGEAYPENPSAVGDLGATSSVPLPDRTTIGGVQGRDDLTHQLRKPPGVFTLFSPKPRPIEANIDDRVKQKHRQSRFHIRKWLG